MKISKILLSLILVVCTTFMSAFCAFAGLNSNEINDIEKYEDHISKFMEIYGYNDNGELQIPEYSTELVYEHYADETSSVPEYVILFVHCNGNGDRLWHEVNGYYLLGDYSARFDYKLTYLVYYPTTKDVCWLDSVLLQDFDEYSQFIKQGISVELLANQRCSLLIGDVNRDYTLNVKDATEIQKFTAELDACYTDIEDVVIGFNDKMYGEWERYISDFNRDGKRDIRDATAIQKYIAGLEY